MSEQLSALMDDEIDVEDADHLLVSLQTSKQAAEAWSHYHLIGDVIRGNQQLRADFKQSLMQRIELEPTVLAPSAVHARVTKNSNVKHKIPAVWAIAASFAAVMVVGWMTLNQQTESDNAIPTMEVAQTDLNEQAIPNEYLMAHRASAPSASTYYIQSVSY